MNKKLLISILLVLLAFVAIAQARTRFLKEQEIKFPEQELDETYPDQELEVTAQEQDGPYPELDIEITIPDHEFTIPEQESK